MSKVAIWGAASGLGAAILDYFHQQGFEVTAIARDPDKNPQIRALNIPALCCDATDQQQVENTVQQLDKQFIHISSMGSFRADKPVDYIGHRYLINALETQGAKRLLLVTSLGCGDSWQYLSQAARKGFGDAVREKSLAEAWLQSSELDYTILRPGGLRDGELSNAGQLSQQGEVHGVITRKEVARLLLKLLQDEQSVGQIYQCVDPTLS